MTPARRQGVRAEVQVAKYCRKGCFPGIGAEEGEDDAAGYLARVIALLKL
jgi:hypothetical protein